MKRTLIQCHSEHNARFVDFGGGKCLFNILVSKKSTTCKKQWLIDVSHMGEVIVRGADAVAAVNTLITNDLETIVDGQALYTCVNLIRDCR